MHASCTSFREFLKALYFDSGQMRGDRKQGPETKTKVLPAIM